VNLLAKARQTIRRQRQDCHHKTALALVRENDTIYHEDVQPANMVTHHHLAKSIPYAGWGRLPHHPDGHGSMRRSQGHWPQPRLYLTTV
jgi:putative transposase